ncbi:TlpA family protein [Actinoplanes lobatus]|uniref:Thiol-disulfide isomerase/thioredoxin n=1 Tax=Actinoplanes lobatus TaxID=113568 RepID=A0A7W7MH60_9ACTN|nr:TlpA family protein disulfide reductase [Actinoplanes lobatus]MBB4750018.1 thiol-disulfide isomerase/thioredoxin [Actinoplanes lobatus]GGN74794.1 TlpA family protein [Actinoplanes lobatus]GIE39092.1 TlpA family protein [Actinoplanes lobatus]
MIVIVAALVLVGVLGMLNLVLTVGVIRRLRESQGHHPGGADPVLPVGTAVGEFTATTIDGDPVDAFPALVGFFSPGCAPCTELLPEFADYARRMPGGRQRVLAVVAGTPETAADYVSVLSEVARVVVASADAPLPRAFRATAFPAVYLLDAERRVLVSGGRMDSFPAPVAAR